MKLIFCEECWDIFKMAMESRSCACGKCTGRYLEDGHKAETNGRGVQLAIGNGSLLNAIAGMRRHESEGIGHDKEAYIDHGRISHAWCRPHEGPGNPRCKVVKASDL